jgi:hypothetical protein
MFDDVTSSGLRNQASLSGEEPISYVKEAAKLQYNVIGLAGVAAFSLLSLSALPLVLAAGLELIYLSVVPNNSRFQRLVRSWKYEEQRREKAEKLGDLLLSLPAPQRARFSALQSLCEIIRGNYRQLSATSQMFVAQMEERLDGLLQAYLRLLSAGQQHRDLLKNTDPSQIKRALSQLEATLESQPAKVQDINRKRIEILTKWLEKYGKMLENAKVIDAQCAAIEDVLQLIRTQSVSLRDPQEVNEQLGGLVHDVEQTEQTVREVEAIFAIASPDEFSQGISIAASADLAPANRNRVRS